MNMQIINNSVNFHPLEIPEIVHHIVNFLKVDEVLLTKISQVSKCWKQACEDKYCAAWNYPYYQIWKENIQLNSEEDTPSQAFTRRFKVVNLDIAYRILHPSITSITDNIYTLRTTFRDLLVSQYPPSFDYWIEKAKTFFFSNRLEEAHYCMKELALIAETSNREEELRLKKDDFASQLFCANLEELTRAFYYFAFLHLFTSQSLKEYLSQQESSSFLLASCFYNYPKIIEVYLDLRDPVLLTDKDIFLQYAAISGNFDLMLLILKNPVIADSETGSQLLHKLSYIEEKDLTEEQRNQYLNVLNQLISNGCDPACLIEGKSAIHLNLLQENNKVFHFLLSKTKNQEEFLDKQKIFLILITLETKNFLGLHILLMDFSPNKGKAVMEVLSLLKNVKFTKEELQKLFTILDSFFLPECECQQLEIDSILANLSQTDYTTLSETQIAKFTLSFLLKKNTQLNKTWIVNLMQHEWAIEILISHYSERNLFINLLVHLLIESYKYVFPRLINNHASLYRIKESLPHFFRQRHAYFAQLLSKESFNRNLSTEKDNTVLHTALLTLQDLQKLVEEDFYALHMKRFLFSCFFTHFQWIIRQIATYENCRTSNEALQVPLQLAQAFRNQKISNQLQLIPNEPPFLPLSKKRRLK